MYESETTLFSGERLKLEDDSRLAMIVSGKVEVYAVTSTNGSFRQQFLVELTACSAAFPSLDEFEQIEILLYAVEDSQVKIFTFEEVSSNELKSLMKNWFSELIKLPWLGLLADKGDDTLIKWRKKNFPRRCSRFIGNLSRERSNFFNAAGRKIQIRR